VHERGRTHSLGPLIIISFPVFEGRQDLYSAFWIRRICNSIWSLIQEIWGYFVMKSRER
jgi:hypothetical protein